MSSRHHHRVILYCIIPIDYLTSYFWIHHNTGHLYVCIRTYRVVALHHYDVMLWVGPAEAEEIVNLNSNYRNACFYSFCFVYRELFG